MALPVPRTTVPLLGKGITVAVRSTVTTLCVGDAVVSVTVSSGSHADSSAELPSLSSSPVSDPESVPELDPVAALLTVLRLVVPAAAAVAAAVTGAAVTVT